LVGFPYDLIGWLIAARENRPIGPHPCLHRVAGEARAMKWLIFLRNPEREYGESGSGSTSVCGKYATRLPEASCDGIVGREACEITQPGVAPANDCISAGRAARISAVSPDTVRWESPAPERCFEHRTLLMRAKQERSPEADVH
jgi:hypothetical protein